MGYPRATIPQRAGLENEVVAIAHPSHHADIQLLRSHLVERGLGGMFVRA